MVKKNKIFMKLCLAWLLIIMLQLTVAASETLITQDNFNTYVIGNFADQVNRNDWAVATAVNIHKVEITQVSEGDSALKMTVGSGGSSAASVYRRGLSINKSVLMREKINVSDTNRRILFRLYDDNTSNPVFAIQFLNGNVVATDGTEQKNVATYHVNTDYLLEFRVNTDCIATTEDTYDLYLDGVPVAVDYKMPRNLSGNIKQIELCEAPAWAVNGTTIIDDFYAAYYTPVVRILEEVALTAPSERMAVGESLNLTLSGKMSDQTQANLSSATIQYSSGDSDIASVDSNGKVTAHSDGSVTITVSVAMGDVVLYDSVSITVVYMSRRNIIDDDFNHYSIGSFQSQSPADYHLENTSGYFPIIVEQDNQSNQVIRFVMEDLEHIGAEYLTGKTTSFSISNLSLSNPFEAHAKIKISSFSNSARCLPFMFYDATGARALTLTIKNGNLIAMNGTGDKVIKEGLSINKWYDLSLVVYHDGNNGTMDLYDVYLDGVLLGEGLKMPTQLGPITRMMVVENTNYAQFSVYLDDVRLTSVRYPEIVSCYFAEGSPVDGASGVSPMTDTIWLQFNNRIKTEALGGGAIKLYQGTDEIPCEFRYEENGKQIEIQILKNLSENTAYSLRVGKGIPDMDGLSTYREYQYTFTTGEFDYAIESLTLLHNQQQVTELTAGQTLNVLVKAKNNTLSAKTGELILVQYDGSGNMLAYSKRTVVLPAKNMAELAGDVTIAAGTKTLGVYIWESLESPAPLTKGKLFPSDPFSRYEPTKATHVHTKVKDFDEQVQVYGNLGNTDGKEATLLVYSPTGELMQIRQTTADVKGNFVFVIPFGQNVVLNSPYQAIVGGSQLMQTEYVCRGKAFMQNLMGQIRSTGAAQLFDLISQHSDYFDVNLDNGSDYASLSERGKSELWEEVEKAEFWHPDELTALMRDRIGKQKRLDAAWKKLGAAQNGGDIIKVWEDYASDIGLDLNFAYGYKLLDTGEKAELGQLFLGKSFSRTYLLKEYFDEQTLLLLLNRKSWKVMEDVINNNYELLGIGFSNDYRNLHQIDQADFLKQLDDLKFSSIGNFVTAFSDLLSRIPSTSVPSGSGGGGSGFGANKEKLVMYEPKSEESGGQPEQRTGFSDVNTEHWAYSYIHRLYEKGIVIGYSDGTFHPDENITRGEFIKILVTAFALFRPEAEADFKDMDQSTWYYRYVASAVEEGILTGYADGRMGGNDLLTRQDMAVFVFRAAKARGIILAEPTDPPEFSDKDGIEPYSKDAVSVLYSEGIINGVGENTFMPLGNATRAMVAKVIDKLLQKGE